MHLHMHCFTGPFLGTPPSLALQAARCVNTLSRQGCTLPAHRYANWGVYSENNQNSSQPDNKLGGENCGVANWTQSTGTPKAWGWDDKPCSHKYIFMCRVQGAWCSRLETGSHVA